MRSTRCVSAIQCYCMRKRRMDSSSLISQGIINNVKSRIATSLFCIVSNTIRSHCRLLGQVSAVFQETSIVSQAPLAVMTVYPSDLSPCPDATFKVIIANKNYKAQEGLDDLIKQTRCWNNY